MLDSCSTLNLISNKSWLSDLPEVDTAMHIHSTGGISVAHKMGYLGNYPTPVWYLAGGHVNILSLRDITQHYWVTMDTAMENALILHGDNGQQHKFTPSGKGLYKWEHMMDPIEDNPCWLFIMTVHGQGDCYTQHTYERAQAARCLQKLHYASSQPPHGQHRRLPSTKLSHHKRRCPGSRRHFWTEPWKPEGKDSLVPKLTCSGWEFSCSPVHSRDSSGRGSLHGHHVREQDPVPGDIIM